VRFIDSGELKIFVCSIDAISALELSSIVYPEFGSGVMLFANCIMPKSSVIFMRWSSFISGNSLMISSFSFRALLNTLR